MGQAEELARVYANINGAVLEFQKVTGSQPFRGEELRRFVVNHTGSRAPGSGDRILRVLRRQGQLNYTVLDRPGSLYQFITGGPMGRRSDFARRPHDDYQTIDPRAMAVLLPYLWCDGIETFAEPCCGEGHLMQALIDLGFCCTYSRDIKDGADALVTTNFGDPDAIITNPPWTREILHPMIEHFQQRASIVWLLFDSDWAYNAHATPYLDHCTDIVAVGRLKWFNDTAGKDNASWYRFNRDHTGGPRFHGRKIMDTIVTDGIKPAELVTEFIKLRDAKKQFDELCAAKAEELYDIRMRDIENQLLDLLNNLGVDSIAGKGGTAYKKVSTSVTIADAREFRRHVIGTEGWDLADWRANKTIINEMVEAGQEVPPGVNRSTFLTIGIRRK